VTVKLSSAPVCPFEIPLGPRDGAAEPSSGAFSESLMADHILATILFSYTFRLCLGHQPRSYPVRDSASGTVYHHHEGPASPLPSAFEPRPTRSIPQKRGKSERPAMNLFFA